MKPIEGTKKILVPTPITAKKLFELSGHHMPPPKPGTCPGPVGPGTCVEECATDHDCVSDQKCCSNGCGHVCVDTAQ